MSKKLKRALKAVLSVVGILVVIGAIWWTRALRNSFPQIDGEINLPGLDAPVDIYRDAQGIPHIYASTEHDLFFAQGFVHAQDRFWQMDMNRHASSGRVSELLGSATIDTDIFLRTLGWERVAKQELEMLDEETLAMLESYSEGVNAYLAENSGSELSLEYVVLPLINGGYTPEPWKPLHTMTWAKAMAWDLGKGKLNIEIDRAILLSTLSQQQLNDLFPPYPSDKPTIVNDQRLFSSSEAIANLQAPEYSQEMIAALQYLKDQLSALDIVSGGKTDETVGSNSWVVSGDLTDTGMPLLANDPHLNHGIPHIWYQIGLHCRPVGPECPLELVGFSFPGTPGIVIGHNDRIAWGYTNMGPDVLDLYIEKINPDNPNQYEVNGEWVDMEILTETIQVGNGDPVKVTVQMTRHGPIISDSYGRIRDDFAENAGAELPEHYAVAVSWTALVPNKTLQAVTKLGRAQNWEEFRAAASDFSVPSQNLLYADVDGNIGYQMPGQVPIRTAGADGRLPALGWTDDYEWIGFIPFEEQPFVFNPPEGYILTANNAVVDQTYPYFLNDVWAYGYRAQRIVDMIDAVPGQFDIAYFQQMQADNKNMNAETLVPVLLQVVQKGGGNDAALDLLAEWDYQMDMDSSAAAIFAVFWNNLLAETFHDEIPEDFWPSGNGRWTTIMHGLIQSPENAWWDNINSDVVESRDDIFQKAFEAAILEIEDALGSDANNWAWSDLHQVYYEHQVMSNFPLINTSFNRGPFGVAGGSSIVNASNWNAAAEDYRLDGTSASFRMIADLSNWQNSLMVMPNGQSGHAGHVHYIDLVDMWRFVEYYPMLWEFTAIEAGAEGHLRLRP